MREESREEVCYLNPVTGVSQVRGEFNPWEGNSLNASVQWKLPNCNLFDVNVCLDVNSRGIN